MKYTKGPWEYVSEITYSGDYPYSKAHRVKIGTKTLTIFCCGADWPGDKEQKANAHIIAAAPDMYEALQLINEKYNRCVICKNLKENGHDYACPIGNSLAKAEGK